MAGSDRARARDAAPVSRNRRAPRSEAELKTRLAAPLVILALAARVAFAQELEPRAYSNSPVGLNFLIAGYGYSEGGAAVNPWVPLTNADIRVHSAFLAYVRTLDVFGRSGKIDVVLPYARVSGSADLAGQPQERNLSGLGDPRLRFSVNLHGAPALSAREFAGYRQDLIVGASLQLAAPTGQYDGDKLINIGTNRWSVKPELGASKAWGPWTLELAAAATFFADNKDFLGGHTRSQEPIYSVQAHVVYSFAGGVWLAVDTTYYRGGLSTVDGVQGSDLQKNSRAGVTLALPVDRRNSIKLYASSGVSTRTGGDLDTAGIAWQHRWGGGF